MSSNVIQKLGIDWLDSEVESLSEINNGLCADFASAVTMIDPSFVIVGVYDSEDLQLLSCKYSRNFEEAVRQGRIGHTALFRNAMYYDAECSSGVSCFEDLPINIRALS